MSSSGPASSSSTPPASLSSVLHTLHSTYTQQQQQQQEGGGTAPTFQFATPPPPFPTVDNNLQSPNNLPSTNLPLESNLPNQASNPNAAQCCNAPPMSSDVSNTFAAPPVPTMSLAEPTSENANGASNQQTSLPVCNIPQFPVNLHPPKWPLDTLFFYILFFIQPTKH